jgi:hypothetical protein
MHAINEGQLRGRLKQPGGVISEEGVTAAGHDPGRAGQGHTELEFGPWIHADGRAGGTGEAHSLINAYLQIKGWLQAAVQPREDGVLGAIPPETIFLFRATKSALVGGIGSAEVVIDRGRGGCSEQGGDVLPALYRFALVTKRGATLGFFGQ